MNKAIYFLVVIILISCKTNTIAQGEKKSVKSEISGVTTEKVKPQKKTFSKDQEAIAPGTIHLEGSVMLITENRSICSKTYKAAIAVRVENILGSGSGIENMISSGQEVIFGFRKFMADDFNILEKQFVKNKRFFIVIEEGRCRDMSEAVYLISKIEEIE